MRSCRTVFAPLVRKPAVAAKPKVMATQRQPLEIRYNLELKLDPEARMSRDIGSIDGGRQHWSSWEGLARRGWFGVVRRCLRG
jgi:hypothetical protein